MFLLFDKSVVDGCGLKWVIVVNYVKTKAVNQKPSIRARERTFVTIVNPHLDTIEYHIVMCLHFI